VGAVLVSVVAGVGAVHARGFAVFLVSVVGYEGGVALGAACDFDLVGDRERECVVGEGGEVV
jgi:hypothetical protein